MASQGFFGVNSFLQTLRNFGTVRLVAAALAVAGTVAFFIVLANRIDTPQMGLLYSDLSLKDSGHIVDKLQAMNVPYELRAQGSQILVPVDRVTRLRMALAEQGLPTGGSVGYEIFNKPASFGTSRFIENIDNLRALEGELDRTIAALNLIQWAQVHLVLPERQLFTRDHQKATASVVIKLASAEQLDKLQIAAIQHLVASSVPGLPPSRVSIVDTDGDLLASGDGDKSDQLNSTNAEAMRINFEDRLARNVQQLLERFLGPGKARVTVNADMNFDRVSTSSDIYDPNGQVVRSTETTKSSDNSTSGSNAVSVSANLPNGQSPPGSSTQDHSTHSQETVNYEISKTVKNLVSDQGTVRRLSVAVLVDGTTVVGPNGKKIYQPLSAQELQKITALVKSAVGFDAKRGDAVDVVNLPFAGVAALPPAAVPWNVMGFNKDDIIRLGETAVVGIVGLLFLLLVVRPMVMRLMESAAAAAPAGTPLLAGPAGVGAGAAALPGPDIGNAVAMQQRAAANVTNDTIDIGQVEGRVAASSMKKIGEIVEKHPEEAVSIVRSWMYQNTR